MSPSRCLVTLVCLVVEVVFTSRLQGISRESVQSALYMLRNTVGDAIKTRMTKMQR